jgi:hypothetical protein
MEPIPRLLPRGGILGEAREHRGEKERYLRTEGFMSIEFARDLDGIEDAALHAELPRVEELGLRIGGLALGEIRKELVEKRDIAPVDRPPEDLTAILQGVLVMEEHEQGHGGQFGKADGAPVEHDPAQGLDPLRLELGRGGRQLHGLAPELFHGGFLGLRHERGGPPFLHRRDDGTAGEPQSPKKKDHHSG